jgi:hypothetical protein
VPVLAKADKGVSTGVCHDGIVLRDSVDDKNTNPGAVWRQLGGISRKALALPFARQSRDLVDQ